MNGVPLAQEARKFWRNIGRNNKNIDNIYGFQERFPRNYGASAAQEAAQYNFPNVGRGPREQVPRTFVLGPCSWVCVALWARKNGATSGAI